VTAVAYDRAKLGTGILHFGPGAFHRAHQADYVDRLLADDQRWGIAAVSLRSAGTVDALKRQDGLYTLAILDGQTSYRTLGAHNRFFGPGESESVRRWLGADDIRIVSSTVTEKGYCLAGDGTLDFAHPDIVRDLTSPEAPVSIVGWLALGLKDRREAKLAPFTPLCCDNMVSNGKKLRQAVIDYSKHVDPELARWIASEVRFPDAMVDSITPAADDGLRQMVREATGLDDAIPVRREAYAAWIIEDILPPGSPDLASVGAVMAKDVGAWEKAKLRILNGAHSTLAYTGLLIGHDTVADAMADGRLARFVERLIREDIIPTLAPSPLDLDDYAADILQRFRNAAIHHKLSQIAWDGSQKLPYRLLDTVSHALEQGRPLHRLAVPLAAWMLFIERQAKAGAEIVDPLADELVVSARSGELVESLLAIRQIFPSGLSGHPEFRNAIRRAVAIMREHGAVACLAAEGVKNG
jgi:fructuronate reductase